MSSQRCPSLFMLAADCAIHNSYSWIAWSIAFNPQGSLEDSTRHARGLESLWRPLRLELQSYIKPHCWKFYSGANCLAHPDFCFFVFKMRRWRYALDSRQTLEVWGSWWRQKLPVFVQNCGTEELCCVYICDLIYTHEKKTLRNINSPLFIDRKADTQKI